MDFTQKLFADSFEKKDILKLSCILVVGYKYVTQSFSVLQKVAHARPHCFLCLCKGYALDLPDFKSVLVLAIFFTKVTNIKFKALQFVQHPTIPSVLRPSVRIGKNSTKFFFFCGEQREKPQAKQQKRNVFSKTDRHELMMYIQESSHAMPHNCIFRVSTDNLCDNNKIILEIKIIIIIMIICNKQNSNRKNWCM